jgi:hypothetical protein
VIQEFINYFCPRYAPFFTPILLKRALAGTCTPSPSPPHMGEGNGRTISWIDEIF